MLTDSIPAHHVFNDLQTPKIEIWSQLVPKTVNQTRLDSSSRKRCEIGIRLAITPRRIPS